MTRSIQKHLHYHRRRLSGSIVKRGDDFQQIEIKRILPASKELTWILFLKVFEGLFLLLYLSNFHTQTLWMEFVGYSEEPSICPLHESSMSTLPSILNLAYLCDFSVLLTKKLNGQWKSKLRVFFEEIFPTTAMTEMGTHHVISMYIVQ